LNAILGEKLVITSDKPQTTRNRIQGIHSDAAGQIVFVDTPGVHRARSRLNRALVDTAMAAIQGVDVVVYLVDATQSPEKEAAFLKETLAGVTVPVILVLNKIDLMAKELLLERLAAYDRLHRFRELVPVAAVKGDNVERLVSLVRNLLPEGPPLFPDDILTDQPERFIVAELIREQVFRQTREEIPYSVAVEVEGFSERPDGETVAIAAVIHVERESQKGVIIGRRGEMLKRIGTAARREIEQLLAARVYLELFVRVSRNWSDNPNKLKEFGYQ
jgi:GTP-binding protein Era